MFNSKTSALISVALCSPFLFMLGSVLLHYEPPFVKQFMTEPDGYTTTNLGFLVMGVALLALPVAFVINALAMFRRAGIDAAVPFSMTPAHWIVGASALLAITAVLAPSVLRELEPFVKSLGPSALLAQAACLLGLLSPPVALLLNRLPRFGRAGMSGALRFQPAFINLVVGAAILLVMLSLATSFALEAAACSIGVPNCD